MIRKLQSPLDGSVTVCEVFVSTFPLLTHALAVVLAKVIITFMFFLQVVTWANVLFCLFVCLFV